jgi:hypothetical protein
LLDRTFWSFVGLLDITVSLSGRITTGLRTNLAVGVEANGDG